MELCILGNICPDTADEAKALVPSLVLVLVPIGCSGAGRLKLHKGDITLWSVDGATDAIVSAANE
ncbi:unnamed protein product [Triticum aestivum]|uniref:(bread wheat) hypothetical protein n=1 Tax=Triticum aestivum TaxID=4565 RepID=A0A7G2IG12_WHEAT|nr:unnamed protein product [Triticum aestivum]